MFKGPYGGVVRFFGVVLMVCFGGVGCERKEDGGGVGGVYPMDEQVLGKLSANWLEAAQHLTLSSKAGSAEPPSLRYAESAECSLVYDFEVTTTTARRGAHEPASARNRPRTEQLLGRFELRPDPGVVSSTDLPAWRLRGRQLGHYVVRNDIRLPGSESKYGDFPDVVLQNTGAALQAGEGESVLWNGLHAFGGLESFFPRLPVVEQAENGTAQVGRPVQGPVVRVAEHLLIDGVPAVVLMATGEQKNGRYVVLNSGRLLHAAISRRVELQTVQGEFSRTQMAEARLTGACGDPMLRPIGHKTSRARSALDTYTRLVFAVHGDHTDRAVPYLSQDLIDAHGADSILEMLKAHVARYGVGVLGDPSLVDPVEVEGQLLRFRVVGRAVDSQPGSSEAVTIVNHIIVEDGEAGMRVLSIASTTNQHAPDSNMLEVSPRRIFTASRSVE